MQECVRQAPYRMARRRLTACETVGHCKDRHPKRPVSGEADGTFTAAFNPTTMERDWEPSVLE